MIPVGRDPDFQEKQPVGPVPEGLFEYYLIQFQPIIKQDLLISIPQIISLISHGTNQQQINKK